MLRFLLWFDLVVVEACNLTDSINETFDDSSYNISTVSPEPSAFNTATAITAFTDLPVTTVTIPSSPACTKVKCHSQTVECYADNERIVTCEGICVRRDVYSRDRKSRSIFHNVSYHCQDYSAYPESAVNMCTDVKVQYPHLKIYKSRKFIYIKYCCKSSLCNKNAITSSYTPILPMFFTQTENLDQLYFDYFIICAEILTVIFVTLWPAVIMAKENKKEQKLYSEINQPMEECLLETKDMPKMKTRKIAKPITGQLKFRELCRDLTNMELRIRKDWIELLPNSKPVYKKFELRAGGNGHDLVKVDRVIMVSYESYVLTQLIEHGPYLYDWTPFELVTLLSQAADIFEGESTMLTLRAPITVIGDIRGQYQDLYRWLSIAGFPPRQKILFLGGVLDREEPGSIDCLAFIAAMKVRFPHDVFLIRGIGETLPIKFQPRFRRRNDSAIQSAATRLCNSLPIAARISNQILAVHSGLSHEMSNYACVQAVKRPFSLADISPLARQLIFSQPTTKISMYRESVDNDSAVFGFGAINRVCHDMGVKLIIRARNPLEDGICWVGKKQKMVSIWSAPAKESNKGAILSICAGFVIHIYTLERQKQRSSKQEK